VEKLSCASLSQNLSAKYIMSSTTSPALPAFSYAQAAKGLAPSASTPHHAASASTSPPVSSSRERKSSSAEPVKLELTSKATNSPNEDLNQRSAGKSTDALREITSTTNDSLKENIQPSKPAGSSSEDPKMTVSETSSPSIGAASTSTLSKAEDISIMPNETSDNWDKQSQVSTSVEKSTQTTGASKAPDTEEDGENQPVSKTPTEKELKAAPIPTVNFWEARKEAQEAKAKALAAQRPPQTTVKAKLQPAAVGESQKAADDESRRKQAVKPPAKPEKENGAAKRKQGDTLKQRDDGMKLLA
jgi:la-related protein 1